MHLLNVLPAFLFALMVAAVDQPTELKLESTYLPDDCTVKAQNGDKLQVHYVRRSISQCLCHADFIRVFQTGKLFSNGNKFDSRSVYCSRTLLPILFCICCSHLTVLIADALCQ